VTIILLCNVCETETINLKEAKVFDYKKLFELTGWEMKDGQRHFCPKCAAFRKKFDEEEENGEDELILYGNLTHKEDIPRKEIHSIDIIGEKTVWRKCRYCDHMIKFGENPKGKRYQAKQIAAHEEAEHPSLFVRRTAGQKSKKYYKAK